MQDEPKISRTTQILLSFFVIASSFVLILFGESAFQIGGILMLLIYGIVILVMWYQKREKNNLK